MILHEYLPFLWIGTAVSFLIFIVFALALRKDIAQVIRRFLPAGQAHNRRQAEPRSFVVWMLFAASALTLTGGGGLLAAAYQGTEPLENAFIAPPTPVPSQTPAPVDAPPLLVTVSLPGGLTPCNVGALTIIPPEVNPYELPLVYPIDPWFQRGQFLQTAFARLNIQNQAPGSEIQVSNQVIAVVSRSEKLTEPLNVAFTLCDEDLPRAFPVLEVTAAAGEYWITAADAPVLLQNRQSYAMEMKLLGLDPGYYEVRLGIEYIYNGQSRMAWADQPVVIQVPQQIQRWSSGVITYWGDCQLEGGEYYCEEVVLEEPVLEPAEVVEQPGGEDSPVSTQAVCPLAPPNRLQIGVGAQVSSRMGLRLRLRTEPGLYTEVITSYPRHTQLKVIGGPVCKDGYYWYQIELNWGGDTGWMAEGEPLFYYLEPTK